MITSNIIWFLIGNEKEMRCYIQFSIHSYDFIGIKRNQRENTGMKAVLLVNPLSANKNNQSKNLNHFVWFPSQTWGSPEIKLN